jgi:nitroimidazol reductase NimA-like FMN-containing flavoprotein (pyridoxamine 5'-phosphate oxidase superfamily)
MAYVKRADLRMTDEEIARFLAAHRWGRLGSVSAQGEPHVSPIGYLYLGGRLYFHGLVQSRRGRDITHEARVALCVDEGVGEGQTYSERRGVVVYARCRVVFADEDELLALLRPGFAERFFGDRSVSFERPTHAWYELTPYRFASWDFGKIPAGADRFATS